MEIVDQPVEVHLTIPSTGALRVLLSQEILRIERWILIHGCNAAPAVLRDIQDYLGQVRFLQNQVNSGWRAFIRPGAAQASRMNGKQGGRPSKTQTTDCRSVPA